MNQALILVIDDEPKMVRLVFEILSAAGYRVISARDLVQALDSIVENNPDLVLLDILLLGEQDGFDLAKRLREFSDVPIIMLTAKSGRADMLRGFAAGVDDYITKPFSAQELLARVRAVLKRAGNVTYQRSVTQISIKHLHIDLLRGTVKRNGQEIHLTPTEFRLLRELALHADIVREKDSLLSAVWGPAYRNDVDYLRTYIHFLRKKIEPDPKNPQIILSSPGIGYMLSTQS